MTTLDTRQLIPLNYEQLTTPELEYLRDIIANELDTRKPTKHPLVLHRELTQIRLILATRRIEERKREGEPLEPEYAAWPDAPKGDQS